jgi:hypothetical protein
LKSKLVGRWLRRVWKYGKGRKKSNETLRRGF